MAGHAQTLTRKFDLLDSNQGSSKHAMLLLDPNGIIKHKQIGDDKVAFDVDDVLSVLIACKVPLFDHSAFDRGMLKALYIFVPFFSKMQCSK